MRQHQQSSDPPGQTQTQTWVHVLQPHYISGLTLRPITRLGLWSSASGSCLDVDGHWPSHSRWANADPLSYWATHIYCLVLTLGTQTAPFCCWALPLAALIPWHHNVCPHDIPKLYFQVLGFSMLETWQPYPRFLQGTITSLMRLTEISNVTCIFPWKEAPPQKQ